MIANPGPAPSGQPFDIQALIERMRSQAMPSAQLSQVGAAPTPGIGMPGAPPPNVAAAQPPGAMPGVPMGNPGMTSASMPAGAPNPLFDPKVQQFAQGLAGGGDYNAFSATKVPAWMQAQGIQSITDPRAMGFMSQNPNSPLAQLARQNLSGPGAGGQATPPVAAPPSAMPEPGGPQGSIMGAIAGLRGALGPKPMIPPGLQGRPFPGNPQAPGGMRMATADESGQAPAMQTPSMRSIQPTQPTQAAPMSGMRNAGVVDRMGAVQDRMRNMVAARKTRPPGAQK